MNSPSVALIAIHSLGCWGDRLFDFAFPTLVSLLGDGELHAVPAVFTLTQQLATLLLAGRIGSALDQAQEKRFTFAYTAVVAQNGSVVLLTSAVLYLRGPLLLMAVVFLGCLMSVASLLLHALISFDWIRSIASSPKERMALNARVRQVYLGSKILAPLGVAIVVSLTSSPSAALKVVCLWNVFSGILELLGLRKLHRMVPALSAARAAPTKDAPPIVESGAWLIWFRHPTALFSIAYALLYAAVMCPGSLLHARMVSQGVSVSSLSLFQTASSLCGLFGTWLAPRAASFWGANTAAYYILGIQLGLLSCAAAVFSWSQSYVLFMTLVALSRISLWAFDVLHTDLMQDFVDASIAGRIATVQMGICEMFALLPTVFVLFAPFDWAIALHLICILGSFFIVGKKLNAK